ncbi:tripartite motif-containing protein 26-like [Argopecten irradians]|uniref:tripartite motif-containing protein 26-like n=1 Tax=Argopecten irradians TaxID=31199 RepID=UPI003717E78C
MASRKKKDYTKLFDLMECGLCKSELCDPRRIECGHVFCLKCLVKQVSNVSECPTCKRPMNPLSGKVDTYPVAKEIASLLQTVASCNNILDEADVNNAKDEDQYDMVDAEEDQSMSFPDLKDVCDLHGYQLVSVCLSCDNELICAKCSIHSSHDKIEISKQSNYLELFLNKTHDKIRKRGKVDRTMEEKQQDMIERHIAEKESIKNEVENIAEEMHANIHWKKEETLHPIENKADDCVKLLTERQERIKEGLLEFIHISEKFGKLSNDGTANFFRKTQRLVKQANIALKEERTSLPEYQTIVFTKNKAVVEDLLNVQLGVPILTSRRGKF